MDHPRVVRLQRGEAVVEQILRASRDRAVLDCAGEGPPATILAEDIRSACAAGRAAERDPFGLRIARAVVERPLDLSGFQLGEPLHFLGCTFTTAPVFEGADLQELVFTGGPEAIDGFGQWPRCVLPGLLANGIQIRRDLVLSGTSVTGAHKTLASVRQSAAIWLVEAKVGGRLLAAGTQIETEADRALQADRARIGGTVRLVAGFRATAEIRLIGASLGGSFDLIGASLEPRNGRALDLTEAEVGSLFLIDDSNSNTRLTVRGRIELSHLTVRGRVLIRGADLLAPESREGPSDYNHPEEKFPVAIYGPAMTVNGQVCVEKSVTITGAAYLPSSTLRGGLSLNGAALTSPGNVALDLSQSTVGARITMWETKVRGRVDLNGANVVGSVDLRRAVLDDPPDGRCIRGVGLRVTGDLELAQLQATGGSLNFRNAVIDGRVDAAGATLTNEKGTTLRLRQAKVGGNLSLCNGFSSQGMVVLNRAVVEGRLRCDGGSFAWTPAGDPKDASPAKTPQDSAMPETEDEVEPGDNPEPNRRGSAFEARSATFRSGIRLGWTVTSGGVDLTHAKTSYLADDPENDWPPKDVSLSGFTYESFSSRTGTTDEVIWDASTRAAWLTRVSRRSRSPWQQAAQVFRTHGDISGADKLLIAQRQLARNDVHGPIPKALDWLKDVTVRYGYRPQRALYGLLALIALVSVVLGFTQTSMRAGDSAGLVYSPAGQILNKEPAQSPTPTPTERVAPGTPCGGGVHCFDIVLYAVDTVVPIIDLKERSTWYPAHTDDGKWLDYLFNICTVLGWILSTIFVLSLARAARSHS